MVNLMLKNYGLNVCVCVCVHARVLERERGREREREREVSYLITLSIAKIIYSVDSP